MIDRLRKLFTKSPGLETDVSGMHIPPERWSEVRPSDQFLVSYPRSGNTWARHLLRDVVAASNPALPRPQELRDLIPDIHIREHAIDAPAVKEFGLQRRIFKSHNVRSLATHRGVYIVRQPADALVSYYHFHRLHDATRKLAEDGPDAFCLAMLEGWIDHVETALKAHADRPGEVVIIAYEDMLADGVSQLRRIVDLFGLTATDAALAEALEKNSFEALKKKEQPAAGSTGERFYRKGRAGTALEELATETVARINSIAGPVYERARAVR